MCNMYIFSVGEIKYLCKGCVNFHILKNEKIYYFDLSKGRQVSIIITVPGNISLRKSIRFLILPYRCFSWFTSKYRNL